MNLAPDDPRHGKASTYQYHGCRCEPCRAAAARHVAEWRRKHPGAQRGLDERQKDRNRRMRQVFRAIPAADMSPEQVAEAIGAYRQEAC